MEFIIFEHVIRVLIPHWVMNTIAPMDTALRKELR